MEAASSGRVSIFPIGFNTFAYNHIMRQTIFLRTFLNSIKRVVVGVPINMLLIVMAAFALSRETHRLAGRQFYVWYFIVPMLVSGGLIPTFLTVKSLGLLNSFWALILPGAVQIYYLILMINFFRTIPVELEEAARIDGASYWRILWQIFVPCALPAVVTLTLFCIVNHWNEWFSAQIYLNRPEDFPLQSYLQVLLNQTRDTNMQSLSLKEMEELSKINNRTYNAAQIVISTLPVLIIYPFLQKYFVTGITLGGVKG
jgi:putative aldouronate transport system permease protein